MMFIMAVLWLILEKLGEEKYLQGKLYLKRTFFGKCIGFLLTFI